MAKKNNPPTRMFSKMREDLDRIAKKRFEQGLMSGEDYYKRRWTKMTELTTRTISWHNVIKELELKPERKKKNGQ